MQSQRCLARAFRPIDFNNPALRQAANAEGDIQAQRTGRDRLHVDLMIVRAELHYGALAELLLDVGQRRIKRLVLVHYIPFDDAKLWRGHVRTPYGMSCR